MKKLKVFSISAILIAICCSFLFSVSVSAASKKRNKFDHKPSGNIYYYDENGHTVKGLVTIRGKKYYYKVRVILYVRCGNDHFKIAESELKQCRYGVRTWTK